MLRTPVKKLVLIVILVIIATYISLPHTFSLFGKNITRPNLDLKIGKFSLSRSFDLHLGLDLAGGGRNLHLQELGESNCVLQHRPHVGLSRRANVGVKLNSRGNVRANSAKESVSSRANP